MRNDLEYSYEYLWCIYFTTIYTENTEVKYTYNTYYYFIEVKSLSVE